MHVSLNVTASSALYIFFKVFSLFRKIASLLRFVMTSPYVVIFVARSRFRVSDPSSVAFELGVVSSVIEVRMAWAGARVRACVCVCVEIAIPMDGVGPANAVSI